MDFEKTKKDLKQMGWNLSDEGILNCERELNSSSNSSKHSSKDLTQCALNFDLAEIGEKVLPDDLGKGKLNEFSGPCVLQIMKIRNAAAPKANEESSVAPRLLQVHLSDGHKTCVAVEHSNFGKDISINTPPGSKVCLTGTMKFRNGFLLLESKNIRLCGGQVDSLYNKWKSAKDAGGFFRNAVEGDEAPPPFVPFGKKIEYKCDTTNPSLRRSNSKGDGNSDNREFSEQRESAIAKVKESMGDTSGKSFAASKKSESDSSSHFRNYDDRSNNRNFNDNRSKNESFRKPGAFKVDEDKCEQICQMGFSRSAAFGALRRHDNNLDEALESLLSSKQPSSNRNDSRNERGNRGGRGGRRSNRGGRSNHNDQDKDNSQQTGATLFDYLDRKMTSGAQNKSQKSTEKSQESDPNLSSKISTSQKQQLDDDALQEEYIMEYVKELSLVETRGESQHQKQNDEEPESHEANPENTGVHRYRSGGNKISKSNSYRNEDRDSENRNDSRKFQSNRRNPGRTGSDRFSRRGKPRQFDQKSDRYMEDRFGPNRFSPENDSSSFDKDSNRNKQDGFGSNRFSRDNVSSSFDRDSNRNKQDGFGSNRFLRDNVSSSFDRDSNRNKQDGFGSNRFSRDNVSSSFDEDSNRNKQDGFGSNRFSRDNVSSSFDEDSNRNKQDGFGSNRFSRDNVSSSFDGDSNRNKQDGFGSNRFSRDNDANSFRRNSNRSRQDDSGSDRFSQSNDFRRADESSERNRENSSGANRFSNLRRHQNSQRRQNEETNDSTEPSSYNDNYDDRNPYNRSSANYNTYSNNRSNRDDFDSGRRSPQKSYEQRQMELPPRLRKKAQNARDSRQPISEPTCDEKKRLTLGETNQQLRDERSSVTTSEERYPVYSSDSTPEKLKSSPSHSYQDQRQQQSRNSAGKRQQNSRDNYGVREHSNEYADYDEDFKWKEGMLCQAIYWHDGQYYKAEIMNVHPIQPTAVVKFVGYDNYEEVLFKDMRPDRSAIHSSVRDHGSYNGPTGGLEFRRGHNGPTRYPRDREKRGAQKPSQSFYQPPAPQQ